MYSATSRPLGDDHLDLVSTAAQRWGILTSLTTVRFAAGLLEDNLILATTQAVGQSLREQNRAAIAALSDQGRTSLTDRVQQTSYTFTAVDHLDPVEVLKACECAVSLCADSPGWEGCRPQKLLRSVMAAAIHRLPGYPEAPWHWTRPVRREGAPLAVLMPGEVLPVPGLLGCSPDQARPNWLSARMVLVTPAAARNLPIDLPPRNGVMIFVRDEDSEQVWEALDAVSFPAISLHWPQCQEWLMQQLVDTDPSFSSYRSTP